MLWWEHPVVSMTCCVVGNFVSFYVKFSVFKQFISIQDVDLQLYVQKWEQKNSPNLLYNDETHACQLIL